MSFFNAWGMNPGSNAQLMSTQSGLLNAGQGGFWGGNNGFWGTNDGNWFNAGGMMGGMGYGGFGPGYAPMGYEDLMPRVEPLGIYRTYAQHADEVVLTMRQTETSEHRDNYSVVDNATGSKLFSCKSTPYTVGPKRNVMDTQGNWLFQIQRRAALPFMGDAYIGLDPINKRTILTFGTKNGINGGMGITFLNTAGAGEQMTLRIGADMYAAATRITDSHGQTVARINRDAATMFRRPFNTHTYTLSIAGHVDSALMVAICICIDEKMTRIPGLHH